VLPPYTAVMVWVPAVSAVVEYDALPLASVALPITVAPSLNWTVPVAAVGVTVAVKVTDCPLATELALVATTVVVFVFVVVMVWGKAAEVLAL
jgi:hypothetical protein